MELAPNSCCSVMRVCEGPSEELEREVPLHRTSISRTSRCSRWGRCGHPLDSRRNEGFSGRRHGYVVLAPLPARATDLCSLNRSPMPLPDGASLASRLETQRRRMM